MIKVSVSLSDFPVGYSIETFFKEFKKCRADGIEIVSGFKTRFPFKSIEILSKQYKLPITTIHQSIWSGLGLYFDKNFLKISKEVNCRNFVVHPLPNLSFDSKVMTQYLERLKKIKKENKIEIMLENLPFRYSIKTVNKFFPTSKDSSNLQKLHKIALEYGFKITFDTSHFKHPEPHKLSYFNTILPSIRNIHLSSFTDNKSHLPIFMGNFKTKEFVSFLERNNYNGLFTLEIYYPKFITFKNYDFNAICKSINFLKNI